MSFYDILVPVGSFWAQNGVPGPLWACLGSPGWDLDTFGVDFGEPWGALGSPWGRFWGSLGNPWTNHGATLGYFCLLGSQKKHKELERKGVPEEA